MRSPPTVPFSARSTSDTQRQVCGKDLPGAQKAGIERGSTVAKTPSDDQLLTWARDVLGMREDVPEVRPHRRKPPPPAPWTNYVRP